MDPSKADGTLPIAETSSVTSLRRHQEAIAHRIRDANAMTEREVLAVGESLRRIVDEARAHVQGSQHALQELASASIAEMIERHTALITEFVEAMQTQVMAQSEAARHATEHTNRIVDLGRNIQHVTMESRILALNANIQAKRLGDAGRSFQVIGQEMKQFSESVRDANEGVQELAEGLLDALPRIRTLAERIQEVSQQFSRDVTARVSEVAVANAQLKGQIADSIAAGDSRLREIVRLSQEALSHLQFQDPIAQSLLACEREIGEVIERAERLVGGSTATPVEEQSPAPQPEELSIESGNVLML